MSAITKFFCVISLAVISLDSNLVGQSCVVVAFGSEPILTLEGLQRKISLLEHDQPGIKETIGNMAKEQRIKLYEQIVDGYIAQELCERDVRANRLDATQEFKEAQRKAREALDGRLYLQAYEDALRKKIEATVAKMTDDELRTYYEKNRDSSRLFERPPFLVRNSKKSAKTGSQEFAPFEQVRDKIRQVIQHNEFTSFVEKHFEELKQKYQVKIDKSCLSRIVDRKGD